MITDSFYKTEYDRGIPFFVRRTQVLREAANAKCSVKSTINVPDLELEQKKKDEEFQIKEESRDQTWEEFLKMFTDHIEKKVDPNTRTSGRRERDLN